MVGLIVSLRCCRNQVLTGEFQPLRSLRIAVSLPHVRIQQPHGDASLHHGCQADANGQSAN